jgi:hypothetical protein
MTLSNGLPLVLGMACVALAMAQMASLSPSRIAAVALALAIALALAGEAASRVSMAELDHWLSVPQRRLDLAALLLVEALVFGNQAIATAQDRTTLRWRVLGLVPPPSMLIALFLAQVWAMLVVDGVDFGTLAWESALVLAGLFALGAWALRVLLPNPVMRTGLRLWLHAAQVGAGLWLARPLAAPGSSPTSAMWDRLAIVALIVISLMALGWLWQRRTFIWNR